MNTTKTTLTQGVAPAPATVPISMPTRVQIELRKIVDTKGSLALLGVFAALTMLEVVLSLILLDEPASFEDLMIEQISPVPMLLTPILAITVCAAEWRHRSAAFTYVFDPRRTRVFAAKILALLIVALTVTALIAVVSLLAALATSSHVPGFLGTLAICARVFAAIVLMTLVGAAISAATLNTPTALGIYIILPQILPQILMMFSWGEGAVPWINLLAVQNTIMAGGSPENWAHPLVVIMTWAIMPLAVGLWRNARKEP